VVVTTAWSEAAALAAGTPVRLGWLSEDAQSLLDKGGRA